MITLTVKGLAKNFGLKKIFSDLNFTASGGTITGISGPNGSGKSTLLKCLTYLLPLSSGEICWKRDDMVIEKSMLRKYLGYAAPYISHYPELTVKENLDLLQKLRKNNPIDINSNSSSVDISSLVHQPYGELSSGQQQRVKLTSAIQHQPDILILDEPTTNLDSDGIYAVKTLISEFKSKQALILLASNRKNELAWCDQNIQVNSD